MTPETLKARIETLSPGTVAEVMDLTGTQDHYRAEVVSPAFAGKTPIEQHRMVYDTVQAEMKSGEIHALSLKTRSPSP